MNAFLRQRVGDESANPHPPVALKPARLTFTPDPHVGHDLPREHADTRRDHNEEHDAHPWRDVAEHFARGVIHIGHSENKIISDWQRRTWIAMGAFSLVKAKHHACEPSGTSSCQIVRPQGSNDMSVGNCRQRRKSSSCVRWFVACSNASRASYAELMW